jgi:hypothetical protein
MYLPEIAGSEGRILATAERLDQKGDYLVMIQTVAAPRLRLLNDIPPASARSMPLPFRPLMGEILGRLHGERVACGSFVAVYRPGRAPRATAGDPRKARG